MLHGKAHGVVGHGKTHGVVGHGKTHGCYVSKYPWVLPWNYGKTHYMAKPIYISLVLLWYMGFAIDLWQNPLDTLIRLRHAVLRDV